MSEIAEAASVALVLADFAANDISGKANIIGAGVSVLGINPSLGTTARFTLWASIQIPSALCPAEFPVEFSLFDLAGELVQISGPAGQPQALRVAQIVQVDKPPLPIPVSAREHLGAMVQVVFDFANGLPLPAGGAYEWRLRIDGDMDRVWSYPFAVSGPPPAAVIG